MNLADVLDVLPDPRNRQGRRYRLGALLALCTIAVLAGATTLVAVARHAAHLPEEIRDRLGLRAAPRATTLGRVLARLDGDTVDAAIGAWLALHCTLPGESDDLRAVAVDGKTLRSSRTVTRRAVHLVAAVTHGERAALNQRQVPGKKGEISAFVPLLTPLDLAGWTVTFDALHTQHAHARFLVEVKNAHYIAIVKDNQCATRRFDTSPPKAGQTRREVCWVRWLTWIRKVKGTTACQETGDRAQVPGAVRRGTRAVWRKLDCLNPNLQRQLRASWWAALAVVMEGVRHIDLLLPSTASPGALACG
ncbi:ISAs1 family transposase [Streptomyces sp. NPDC002346]